MPTVTSEKTMSELARLIEEACDRGDSVSAIAERAGVQRELVSGIRNGSYRYKPTLDRFEAICAAIGVSINLTRN